jgi:hypothetical protein
VELVGASERRVCLISNKLTFRGKRQISGIGDWFMLAKAYLSAQFLVMDRLFPSIVAVLFAAFTFSIQPSAQAEADETFGNSANEFNIAFRPIYYYPFDATTDNLVPYAYRIGIDEISEDDITKATASGLIGVTAGARTGDQPAGNLRWLEAAAFVNWMNTSTGNQEAYNLSLNGSTWTVDVWPASDAWGSAEGILLNHPWRHKRAKYFLPNENEWLKAESSNPDEIGPVSDWTDSLSTGPDASLLALRPGCWLDPAVGVLCPGFGPTDPIWQSVETEANNIGFRVASVPEPSTAALVLMAGGAWLFRKRLSCFL